MLAFDFRRLWGETHDRPDVCCTSVERWAVVWTLQVSAKHFETKSPDTFCRFESFDHAHRSAARRTEPRGTIGTFVRIYKWRSLAIGDRRLGAVIVASIRTDAGLSHKESDGFDEKQAAI